MKMFRESLTFGHFFVFFLKQTIMLTFKIMLFILVLSALMCIRSIAKFFVAFAMDKKAEYTKTETILSFLSIAYIVTIIISGFNL